MSKKAVESTSRPIPPYLSRDTGQVEAYGDAVRYMNQNDLNQSGYGYCPACRGYHNWQISKLLGCVPSRQEFLN